MTNLIPNINKDFLNKLFSIENEDAIKRLDNRLITEYRPITINHITSSFNSPIKVSLGNTEIISQINSKLVQPKQNYPNEGIISFQVDTHHLKPNADYNSSNESLNEFRISISTILEKCLKESHALDTNILCVIPGKIVWKITVEICIIRNDGNVFDAVVIAALASWLSYRIPFFRIKENELYYDSFINLTTIHMPVCVSYGVYIKKNKTQKIFFMLDNTLEEEGVMNGNISICANIFGEISYMVMNTEAQIDLKEIQDLMGSVEENVSMIHGKIKKFVEEENKRIDRIIKTMKLGEKKQDDNKMDEKEENKRDIEKIKNMMEIEEKIETKINILDYNK